MAIQLPGRVFTHFQDWSGDLYGEEHQRRSLSTYYCHSFFDAITAGVWPQAFSPNYPNLSSSLSPLYKFPRMLGRMGWAGLEWNGMFSAPYGQPTRVGGVRGDGAMRRCWVWDVVPSFSPSSSLLPCRHRTQPVCLQGQPLLGSVSQWQRQPASTPAHALARAACWY